MAFWISATPQRLLLESTIHFFSFAAMKYPVLIGMLLFISLQIQADSLDIKIGQMIMAGMQGQVVLKNSTVLRAVQQGKVGGILLFERNLSANKTQTRLLEMNTLLQNDANIPLIISIDQEGGQVNRLKTKYGFPEMPSAKSVGDKNDDGYAEQIARTIAQSLIRTGINLNYAPVLDLHQATCPVLGKRNRCFSDDPSVVAHLAAIYIEQHRNQGVRTVVKHFPGHGSSRSDSHLGVVDVTKYWSRKELEPYRQLISDGQVEMVMTAHIVNRQLDPAGLPATLSKAILQNVLRKELGFEGVIISDDMQMHAISSNYGFEESIRLAIEAGVDILLFSNNIGGASNYSIDNIHATIKRLVKEGKITQERIDASYRRIMQFKRNMSGGGR